MGKHISFLILLSSTILLSCSKDITGYKGEVGSVKILFSEELTGSVANAEVVVSAPDMDTLSLRVQPDNVSIIIDGVPVGPDRKIEFYIYEVDSLYGLTSTDIKQDILAIAEAELFRLEDGYFFENGQWYADYFPLRVGNTWTYSYHTYSRSSGATSTTTVDGTLDWQIVDAVVEDSLKTYFFEQHRVTTEVLDHYVLGITITEIDTITTFSITEHPNHELSAEGSSFIVGKINSYAIWPYDPVQGHIRRYYPVSEEIPDEIGVMRSYDVLSIIYLKKMTGLTSSHTSYMGNNPYSSSIKLIEKDIEF